MSNNHQDVDTQPGPREGMGAIAWGVLAVVAAVLAALACLLPAGCASAPPELPSPEPFAVIERTGTVAHAVIAGLTAVNRASYGGWSGACPGCDVDADAWRLMCERSGVDRVWLLRNAQATRAGLRAAYREACQGLQPDDLVIVFFSGHGGQKQDIDHDEDDGYDETLCAWDGELSDDELATWWAATPAGVRVWYVTDSCNSGSNYKLRPRNIRRSVPRSFAGALIHYGGCPDGKSSYGAEQGGTFTTAMVDAFDLALNYWTFFASAAQHMPARQTPVYAEYGNVTDEFRYRRIFK